MEWSFIAVASLERRSSATVIVQGGVIVRQNGVSAVGCEDVWSQSSDPVKEVQLSSATSFWPTPAVQGSAELGKVLMMGYAERFVPAAVSGASLLAVLMVAAMAMVTHRSGLDGHVVIVVLSPIFQQQHLC